MLVLSVRLGDDIFIGQQQIIVHRVEEDDLIILTETEEIPVRLGDKEGVDLNEDGKTRVSCETGHDAGTYRVGVEAPRDVLILTGRNYRKQLEA